MTDKLNSHHRDCTAVLQISQSSAFQVMHNQESRKAFSSWGWRKIDVVDEDLGDLLQA